MARGDTFTGAFDIDGFHLSFNIEDVASRPHTIELDGEVHLRLDTTRLIELVDLLEREHALEHVAEYRRRRAEYEAASPAEREQVIRPVQVHPEGSAAQIDDDTETGYALDDPKHPTYHDRMVGWD